MSLVLVFFMAKKMSLFQMWRVGDAVNVILLLMEKGQGFSVFPKGALNGFVSFPLQVCPTAGSLQLGDFVSGLCSLYAGLCDLHCHEECKCPPSVQMGGGLRCTGHSTNDRRLAVRSSVRKNRGESAKEWVTFHRQGAFAFILYLPWDTVSELQRLYTAPLQTCLGITGAFPLSYWSRVVSILLLLIYLSHATFITLAFIPKSRSLKRWEISFPGICACLGEFLRVHQD